MHELTCRIAFLSLFQLKGTFNVYGHGLEKPVYLAVRPMRFSYVLFLKDCFCEERLLGFIPVCILTGVKGVDFLALEVLAMVPRQLV